MHVVGYIFGAVRYLALLLVGTIEISDESTTDRGDPDDSRKRAALTARSG